MEIDKQASATKGQGSTSTKHPDERGEEDGDEDESASNHGTGRSPISKVVGPVPKFGGEEESEYEGQKSEDKEGKSDPLKDGLVDGHLRSVGGRKGRLVAGTPDRRGLASDDDRQYEEDQRPNDDICVASHTLLFVRVRSG